MAEVRLESDVSAVTGCEGGPPGGNARGAHHDATGRWDVGGVTGVVLLGLFIVALAVHHVLWLHHFRSGLPLDIDESGYLGFAYDDLRGWTRSGVSGLWQSVVGQRQFGPLVPLVASPIVSVVGPRPIAAMTVQIVFLAVLGFSVLGLGRVLVGARAALLLAIVTLLLPGVLDFSRTFHLVIASTALLSAAVWALVRSDGLVDRRWVVAAGAFSGLMLLSRTMSLAFLPGLGAAAILMVFAAPRARRTRCLVNLGAGSIVGFAVAAWWYLPNLTVIIRYLTAYGYGAQSRRYVADRATPLALSFWSVRLRQLVYQGLHLGIATVITVTFVVAIVVAVRKYRRVRARRPSRDGPRPDRAGVGLTFLATPTGTVAVVLVISYLALTSSKNAGTGFAIPLLPLIVLLWGVAIRTIEPAWVRAVFVAVLGVAVAVAVISKATVTGPVAGPTCLEVPAMNCVPVLDGRGVAQQEPWARSWAGVDPSQARRGRPGRWVTAAADAAAFVRRYAHEHGFAPVAFFASRDPLFNTNSLGLAARIQADGETIPMGQLTPDPGGDRVRNYRRHLDDPRFGWPNVLITVAPGPFEFEPTVDQTRAERAARELGFRLVHRQRLPDDREARFFWLPRGAPAP